MTLLRRGRRFFSGGRRGSPAPLRAQRRAFDAAVTLVSAFYAGNLFFAFQNLRLGSGHLDTRAIEALWPVFWVEPLGIAASVSGMMLLMVVGAAAAALLPGRRVARILAFLGVFFFHAYLNSFGKINHAFHGWILASFLLIFLPDGGRERLARRAASRQRYLNAFWSAMAVQGLTYTLAGSWKALAAIPQALRGEVHSFSPDGLATHIAHRLLQTNSDSLLGPFFIDHAWIGWPSFVFVLYLQVFALWAVFRPSLHRLWGIGLISFHFMVYLTMSIAFGPPVLLLGLCFVCSPFAGELDLRAVASELPLFGPLLRRLLVASSAGRLETGQGEQLADGALGAHGLPDR